MSIAENIKTAEEHLEAESKRELDRLLGTLAEECVYEENLLKRSVRGKEEVAQYYHLRDDLSGNAYRPVSRHSSYGETRGGQRGDRLSDEGWKGVRGTDLSGRPRPPYADRAPPGPGEDLRPPALLSIEITSQAAVPSCSTYTGLLTLLW